MGERDGGREREGERERERERESESEGEREMKHSNKIFVTLNAFLAVHSINSTQKEINSPKSKKPDEIGVTLRAGVVKKHKTKTKRVHILKHFLITYLHNFKDFFNYFQKNTF